MKLKQYAENILKLAVSYPDADVVYSSDDEGNNFQAAHYDPSPGHFDGDGGWIPETDFQNLEEENEVIRKINSVCILSLIHI